MTVGSKTTTYTLDLAAPLRPGSGQALVQVLVAHQSTNPQSTTYLYGVTRIGEDDGDWRYHLADHLGNMRSLVGADGSVEGTRVYRPYGSPLSVMGSADSIYGFTGEQMDPTPSSSFGTGGVVCAWDDLGGAGGVQHRGRHGRGASERRMANDECG